VKTGTVHHRWLIRLLFIVVVPCLFLQIKLREITEPYPAILLPAGGGLLQSRGNYTAHETEYLAEDMAGIQHPFSMDRVLDGVPTNYHAYVVARGFGINDDRDVRRLTIPIPGYPLRLQFGRFLTPAQIEETQAWLRLRLRDTLKIEARRILVFRQEIQTFYEEVPPRQERRLQRRVAVELIGGIR
jgi:hypothetical protein